jgi:hypothetical protein
MVNALLEIESKVIRRRCFQSDAARTARLARLHHYPIDNSD